MLQMTPTTPQADTSPRVPDTDADNTSATWEEVRKNLDMSARGTKREGRLPRGAASDAGKSSLSERPSLVDAGESVGTPDSTLTSRTGITPRSAKFTDLVLQPRGISVNDTNAIVPSAFAHFDTRIVRPKVTTN